LRAGGQLKASITVKNTGKYDGEEVVQLYIQDRVASAVRPVRELKGFQKVFLKKGESREVAFTISENDLKFYNYNLQYDWEPGEFEIMIGPSSREVKKARIVWNK
jgi:beta-glucosidase